MISRVGFGVLGDCRHVYFGCSRTHATPYSLNFVSVRTIKGRSIKSYFHSRSSSLHPSVLGPRAPMPPEVFQNHQRNNAPESSEHPSILFNGWWPKKTVKTLVAHTRAIGGPGIFLRRESHAGPLRDLQTSSQVAPL